MTAREAEATLLRRCAEVALGKSDKALDAREANVFAIASHLLRSSLPGEALRLQQASRAYLDSRPGEVTTTQGALAQGWIITLPRLRDMLSTKIRMERDR